MTTVWEGSRALGLHPWHPDVANLSDYQLWWAIVQSREEKGKEPRRKHEETRANQRQKDIGDLMAWADSHLSRR